MTPKTFLMATVLSFVLLSAGVVSQPAYALCAAQPEDGRRENADPQTRSLTRIQLRFVCQDQILNGQLYPPGPPWYVHIFGKCSPSDCDWDEVWAQRLSSGHIYTFYDQGFARRHFYARMSQYRPGQLWVYTWTNFTNPNRRDYGVHNWFRREATAADVNCSRRGSSSIFVANFDGDVVGSPPAPSTPLHYGPPGAALNATGQAEILNSTALGSKALRTTRPPDIIAVVGDNGTAPYTSGTYCLEFKAPGAVIPPYLIAAPRISARSAEDTKALMLRLYAGSYHLDEATSSVPVSGSYDPGAAHFVHVELKLDSRRFALCINDQVVAFNQTLFYGDFTNLHSLQIVAPQTITEAFPAEYVVDDIRIAKCGVPVEGNGQLVALVTGLPAGASGGKPPAPARRSSASRTINEPKK
ncbi:MAG: hypothetical protein IID38_10695 [Planctomycetes bacterium]|nr:hypothetical protein [Planctomycetota bacterium]